MPHIFISYARADKTFVERLIQDLQAADIEVWIDQEGLKPGTRNWEQALRDAIRSASAVLLLASPASRRSNYVQDELAIADMYRCPLYPIWIDGEQWIDCIPIGLGKMQYIDARGAEYPAGLTDLITTLGGIDLTHRKSPDPVPDLPADFTPRNPYKGLRAFREEDHGDYFGREKFISTLVEATLASVSNSSNRLLAIIGPSGSGKSSVIMAGLLPKLRSLPPSKDWIYLDPMVPGTHPLERLQITLANAMPERSHRNIMDDLIDTDGRGLHLMAAQITRLRDRKVILFIDQFEELFTLVSDEDERRQFITLLTNAVTESDGALLTILTLRADFYDRPMAGYPALAELLKNHYPVLPMTLDDLRAVIERPATLPDVRLTFEDGLVGDVLFEVRDQVGGLPLLQFTLDQLFEKRDGQRLTLMAYRAMGGVRGALAKHAESTYASLPSGEHQRLARALFLRLIEPGATEQDTTRRRASRAELVLPDAKQTEMLASVVDTFVKVRLLTTDNIAGEDTVEVSHEALIREWSHLKDWVTTAREDILLQKKISADTIAWVKDGCQPDYGALYSGRVLREAQSWSQRHIPSVQELEFLQMGVQRESQLEALEESRKRELVKAAQRAEQSRHASLVAARKARTILIALVIFVIIGIIAFFIANAEYVVTIDRVNNTLTIVSNQVANANATLTVIPATQEEAWAQGTFIGVQVSLITTYAPVIAGIPPTAATPLTPPELYATITQVANLSQWQPVSKLFDGVEMVEVPAGCFYMGSYNGNTNERPVSEICFSRSFWIDKYEVTNEQFDSLKGQALSLSTFTRAKQPRDNVSWFEAQVFCEQQRHARLPTEAEWEYAARGPYSQVYPWGNNFIPANVVYNEGSPTSYKPSEDVDSRPEGASWVGALHLSGNLWEWVNTIYDVNRFPYPYRTYDGRESDSQIDTGHVLRGGSSIDNDFIVRPAGRTWQVPSYYRNNVGFRCARS